jgi:hypothetical protein
VNRPVERHIGRLKPTARHELVGRLFVRWSLSQRQRNKRPAWRAGPGVNRPAERHTGRLTPTARHELVGRLFLRWGLSQRQRNKRPAWRAARCEPAGKNGIPVGSRQPLAMSGWVRYLFAGTLSPRHSAQGWAGAKSRRDLQPQSILRPPDTIVRNSGDLYDQSEPGSGALKRKHHRAELDGVDLNSQPERSDSVSE